MTTGNLSVCLYVCRWDDNFQKPWCRKFIFAHPVYLPAIRIKFVYEGHRVKVKVTGAKNRKFLFPQCTTSIGNNSVLWKYSSEVGVSHGAFDYGGSNAVTAHHLCHGSGSVKTLTKCTHSRCCRLRLAHLLRSTSLTDKTLTPEHWGSLNFGFEGIFFFGGGLEGRLS